MSDDVESEAPPVPPFREHDKIDVPVPEPEPLDNSAANAALKALAKGEPLQ
jgi:hypothetical protein